MLFLSSLRVLLQLDREKQAEAVLQELASIIARYRGPLLESSVDLEQRLWHLATMTGEVRGEEQLRCRSRCTCAAVHLLISNSGR
jgi:hypothetical protein